MPGNKPTVPFGSEFSKRAAALNRVAYCPYPHSSSTCKQVVWMVIDELLVGEQALALADPRFKRYLERHADDTGHTVFEKFKDKPCGRDVAIWRLKSTPGVSANPDVAEAVWAMRRFLPYHLQGQIAPNHVLIPAPDFHACPWGSPVGTDEDREELIERKETGQPPNVTIIDSGYIESGPIQPRLGGEVVTGEWFTKDGGGYAWERQPRSTLEYLPENLDQDIGRLYALVGHANFVAGVVAQACPEAVIRVISHDGAFVEREADTPVPTEAAVARSMWLATGAMPDDGDPMTPADVINVGFAFPTLPSDDLVVNPAVGDGPESWTMNLVLECTDTDKHIFVAPAGNQSCTTPYYPAAFSRWVIGVGSARNGVTSIFSNRGSWVGFQADGETVVSTFIEWAGDTEEPDPPDTPPPVGTWTWKTFTGWAIWSGTSFAAPQIAAAAASIRAANPGATFRDTWNALRYLDSSRYAVRRQGNFRFRP